MDNILNVLEGDISSIALAHLSSFKLILEQEMTAKIDSNQNGGDLLQTSTEADSKLRASTPTDQICQLSERN